MWGDREWTQVSRNSSSLLSNSFTHELTLKNALTLTDTDKASQHQTRETKRHTGEHFTRPELQSELIFAHMFPAPQHTVSEQLSYRCGCVAGSPPCQQSRLPLARPVCGWWRSALTAGWSPPGWRTGWPHRCAEPAACCHPSFSGFLPEEKKGIQTRCHADKLTISCGGRCPQINSSSFTSLSVPAPFLRHSQVKSSKQFVLSLKQRHPAQGKCICWRSVA